MPFDPNLPAENSPGSSAEMRAQLNGLKALIDAVPAGPPGPVGPAGPQGSQGPAGLPLAVLGEGAEVPVGLSVLIADGANSAVHLPAPVAPFLALLQLLPFNSGTAQLLDHNQSSLISTANSMVLVIWAAGGSWSWAPLYQQV